MTSKSSHSPFFEPIFLPLVEQVRLRAPQVNNLRTSVPILPELETLLAVVRVGYTHASADDAPSLERTVIALVADVHYRRRVDERVADGTLAWRESSGKSHLFVDRKQARCESNFIALTIALFTESADGNTRLLSAHHQVRMMLRHRSLSKCFLFVILFPSKRFVPSYQKSRFVVGMRLVEWMGPCVPVESLSGENLSLFEVLRLDRGTSSKILLVETKSRVGGRLSPPLASVDSASLCCDVLLAGCFSLGLRTCP